MPISIVLGMVFWDTLHSAVSIYALTLVYSLRMLTNRLLPKTRVNGLPDSEDRSILRSLVLTQYRRVTDRQTDRQTDSQTELPYS